MLKKNIFCPKETEIVLSMEFCLNNKQPHNLYSFKLQLKLLTFHELFSTADFLLKCVGFMTKKLRFL